MRLATVDPESCNPEKCGLECIKACPVNRKGEECVHLNESKDRSLIQENLCIGCGICVRKCPFDAVKIVETPEELEETPTHKYGKNLFQLFKLPIPKPGKVLGLIGRNGTGKSTALKLLSGKIKPNFGNFETPPPRAEIEKHYANKEIGEYFETLFSNQIKTVIKPQRVRKNLKNRNLTKILTGIKDEKIIETLELANIKNKQVEELSGGELQRLCIAECLSQEADFYFFDEPASFLDVENRMEVSRLIKELSRKNKSVVVVEHDLTILDYIADRLQIIYGEPAVYGIISSIKSVRRGINEYLTGYLKEENLRIRKEKIEFSKLKEIKEGESVLMEYPSFEKKLGEFKLRVSKGKLHTKEILSVMGPNALGKTTFLKILAGRLTPDKVGSGKKEMDTLPIAYKPQSIKATSNNTVKSHLLSLAGEEYYSSWYKSNIIEGLRLNEIEDRKIKNLSGGELQKVYIASTLSQGASIYAFDEPTAFVDVEDRMKVAKIIRSFVKNKDKACVVVDHDVQFIDFLGDRMLVFKGTPGKTGKVEGPLSKNQGMNKILKSLDITYRRDEETNRPRINKPGSVLDREQRKEGKYYYA